MVGKFIYHTIRRHIPQYSNIQLKILQRVEPLLCNDRDISKYTRAVSDIPAATDTNTTILQQQRNDVFYVVRAEML
jgi:hypothetical protein